MSQKPYVIIDAAGNVTVGVESGEGQSCLEVTRKLEEALARNTEVRPDKVLTEDYSKPNKAYLTEGY